MQPQDIVRKIIDSNIFLVLSTTNGVTPWGCPLFYASDKNYNLYFTSYNDSLHVKHILRNPNVAVVIFDSHIVPGQGQTQGLQIQATCHRISKEKLPEAIEIVYAKRFPDSNERAKHDLSIERFSKGDSEGRVDHIYKIIPQYFYILDRVTKKDTRIEVQLQ